MYDKIEKEPDIKKIVIDKTIHSNLSEEQDKQVSELLLHHSDTFSKSELDTEHCDRIRHRIGLIDETSLNKSIVEYLQEWLIKCANL